MFAYNEKVKWEQKVQTSTKVRKHTTHHFLIETSHLKHQVHSGCRKDHRDRGPQGVRDRDPLLRPQFQRTSANPGEGVVLTCLLRHNSLMAQ